MKNLSLIFNVVLLVLVGILFYLHFSSSDKKPKIQSVSSNHPSNGNNSFKIGYFEWDSVTNRFGLFKEMQNELEQKDKLNAKEKLRLRQYYQDKVNGYSQRALSQVESEMATREIKKLEVDISNQLQKLDQDYQELQARKNNEVRTKIEDFLKEYNKSKGYSFVFAYEPMLIFYRDSVYDITSDLINGLNEKYPKKK